MCLATLRPRATAVVTLRAIKNVGPAIVALMLNRHDQPNRHDQKLENSVSEELWRQSATKLAELIRKHEASSVEVVESHLRRIEAVNSSVNAITVVLADSALEAAKKADASSGTGPLHGVPFTVKENIDCMGSATTQGVPAFAEAMPTRDAPVVERMKAAGAIPIARTNLPEFGLRISTDNPLRGRTLNPWDATRVAGGSSGGEGAALATGMTPIGLGNDIGGSVRSPAYCCGVLGLKPTTGRIPHVSSLPPEDSGLSSQIMLVEGPMARHVEDLRLGYEILSGRNILDPVSVDAPLYGPDPTNKRAALVIEVPGVDLPASSVAAIKAAGAIMASQGWKVEEVNPPELASVTEVWGQILAMDICVTTDLIGPLMAPGSSGMLRELVAKYRPDELKIPIVHAERDRLSRLWSLFFADYPIVLGPTWTDIPFLHDEDIQPGSGVDMTIDRIRFITPANVLGIPALALPMGVSEGLPTGIQVYADRWREDLCLLGAEMIQAEVGQICPIDPIAAG
jgi:amidase